MTTAKYPTALAALSDFLGELPNFPTMVLSGAHNSSVTTITLTATVLATWPTVGAVTIDSEIIAYGGKSGATLTSCTRGSQGTTAASHADAATVGFYLTAATVNQVLAEVIAVETALGISLGNVLTSTLTVLLKGAKSANIASAATTDLSTATGNEAHITGTVTITGFGTLTAGTVMNLIFDGSLKVTYNATSLILRAAKDFYTSAGDTLTIVSEGGGNWRELTRTFATPYVQGTALAADVTMTTGGTEYDGPTVALTAGGWDVGGRVQTRNTSGAQHQARAQLWLSTGAGTGSTVYASTSTAGPANSSLSMALRELVDLTASGTVKISCKDDTNGALIKAATDVYGVGNNAGQVTAWRVY